MSSKSHIWKEDGMKQIYLYLWYFKKEVNIFS